jgi:hypothetical protein
MMEHDARAADSCAPQDPDPAALDPRHGGCHPNRETGAAVESAGFGIGNRGGGRAGRAPVQAYVRKERPFQSKYSAG